MWGYLVYGVICCCSFVKKGSKCTTKDTRNNSLTNHPNCSAKFFSSIGVKPKAIALIAILCLFEQLGCGELLLSSYDQRHIE